MSTLVPIVPLAREKRGPQKGRQTKAAIVDAALALATQIGLQGLSIGALAEVMGMRKSGVLAHFGSREELQISVARQYHVRFEIHGLILALHYAARFLKTPGSIARANRGFDDILVQCQTPSSTRIKPRLLTHGGGANPRASDGHRCGLRLALRQNALLYWCRQASNTALARRGAAAA
ncbi:TetR/AcrR family transcriptional regulator [Ramlibacter sp. H39-3-26]|nr:TetR/AcrR family transcriptional regulator [Ramlibacter sp. H39-3-26]MDF1486382.1 TetR/AcrR family transcriptional regulator [Ramlibacter sp. H39-3-26]